MNNQKNILCFGEVLWDALPMGLFLGGAPLNVSIHLHLLGEHAHIISRVGNDRLGKEAIRRITAKNLSDGLIQNDEHFETGIVEVKLDHQGNPEYEIIEPVAWDNIKLTPQMEAKVEDGWALVYGSLVLRDKRSRNTIYSLLQKNILKVFDINLRSPFYNKQIIEDALKPADILKLNADELEQLKTWFSLSRVDRPAIRQLAERFDCSTITVTRGEEGAIIYHGGQWAEHQGFSVDVKDAVGAGDAFLAALLQGIRKEKQVDEMLTFANAAGAFVAAHDGATPEYTYKDLNQFYSEI